jgi:hypothetical protein
MEHALALLVERGAGRDAAIVQNNLAIARYPIDGPARSLADFDQGIEFCEQRGLTEAGNHLESSRPGLLVELGRIREAQEAAARLAPTLEASGTTHTLIELRAVDFDIRVARGQHPDRREVETLVDTARESQAVDITGLALSAAAAALAEQAPRVAHELLAEAEQIAGNRESPYYARQLPSMVRTALAVGDAALASRLVHGIEPRYPLEEHALCAARAQIAEHAGDRAEAAALHAEAARRWQDFGHVPERAYALLGRGRCLRSLELAGAEEPLREAAELFASMGYEPVLTETAALLEVSVPTP